MIRLKTPAILLGATALTVPLAFGSASAQQEGACEQLYQLVQQSEAAGEELLEEFQRAPEVAEANEAEACVLMIEQVEVAGGITAAAQERGQGAEVVTETETFSATDTISETVTIEQRAIVEGEVLVRQPVPEIEVQEGAAEVQVRNRPSQIEVDEQPARIVIRQKQANVRVAVPRPTIMIEQPAPEIVITMPAPGVNVVEDQPQVDVVVAEPTITFAQADPEVEVEVEARLVGAEEFAEFEASGGMPRIDTRTELVDAAGNVVTEPEPEVTVITAEPTISLATPPEPQVTYNRINPEVIYEPTEPNVEVVFSEEPRVEIQQVGEPVVRVRRQGEADATVQEEGALEADVEAVGDQAALGEGVAAVGEDAELAVGEGVEAVGEGVGEGVEAVGEGVAAVGAGVGEGVGRLTPDETNELLGVEEGVEVGAGGELIQVVASDLEGRDVITLRGEEIGEIEGIYQNAGLLYAVVSHGGFLGIGEDQVALPAERLAVRGDQVILLGLTEEQIGQMPEYNFDTDQELAGSEVVEIGRYE